VEAIYMLAKKYNLKVIYDAAHCFGVKYKNKSIFEYGDIATCSFHATKIFHTGEGGAIFCKDAELFHQIYYSHNFGHNGPLDFHGLGINGKMSELSAAMGLTVLPYVMENIVLRKNLIEQYVHLLSHRKLKFLTIREQTNWNYSYFPVIFENEVGDSKRAFDNLKSLKLIKSKTGPSGGRYLTEQGMQIAKEIKKRSGGIVPTN
jgi:dTDP-4-amino-4,6-dideoxygalactose transaminase